MTNQPKPKTISLSVRLPASVYDIVSAAAFTNRRSLNGQIVWMLEKAGARSVQAIMAGDHEPERIPPDETGHVPDVSVPVPRAPAPSKVRIDAGRGDAWTDDECADHLVALWNKVAVDHGLVQVSKITPQRRAKLIARALEVKDTGQGRLSAAEDVILGIKDQPLLLGKAGNGKWKCTFDWLIEPRNWTKVEERTYEERKNSRF